MALWKVYKKKALSLVAKKKGFEKIAPWIKAIVNRSMVVLCQFEWGRRITPGKMAKYLVSFMWYP